MTNLSSLRNKTFLFLFTQVSCNELQCNISNTITKTAVHDILFHFNIHKQNKGHARIYLFLNNISLSFTFEYTPASTSKTVVKECFTSRKFGRAFLGALRDIFVFILKMPFYSKDWRSPGEEWVKTQEGWEKKKVLECTAQR